MYSELKNLSRLCIHTQTNRSWTIGECIKKYAEAGIGGISVWRNVLEGQNLQKVRTMLDDYHMKAVSLVRGGFFASAEKEKRRKAIEDNQIAISQAAAIGAPLLVLVCGADGRQSLETSRDQIREGIESLLPFAAASGVKLAIEPLHPMYAGDRSAINTLTDANDLAEAIGSPWIGIAVDVYHLWWDHRLKEEIARCGRNGNLLAFHICDWNVPTVDFLNDRGLMGEGCIDLPAIRGWVEEAGFEGFHEVEIFSEKYWSMDQDEYLKMIINAYLTKS